MGDGARSRAGARGLLGASWSAWVLLGLGASAACGDDTARPVAPWVGEACAPDLACAAGLLCVDGRCSARPWPSDAGPTVDVVVPIDLGVVGSGDSEPGPEVADIPVHETVSADAGATTRLWLGEHTAVEAPSDDAVTLQVDQAAVVEVEAPRAGRLGAIEVLAIAPTAATACGVFRVVVWAPEAGAVWPLLPAWTGPERALVGSAERQVLLEPEGPPIAAGAARVGLLYVRPCPDVVHAPRVVVDASGETAQTWVWARVGAAAAWVAGGGIGLSGRWALRAGLDAP